MSAKAVRAKLEQLMQATLADERAHGTWSYRAVRPLPLPPSWHPGQWVASDCSWGCKLLCRWAGAPDPMGNNYQAWGNSSTICIHLPHAYYPHELQVGDIVTFGSWGGEHAAMVLEPGTDPLLWSDGHQGAPDVYRLSQDPRGYQLCVLMPNDPKPPPTPQDILRAKTGYFSWVQWKLGEGAWRHFAPAAPAVRPNVPKVIPADWWRRYVAFLLARKKGNKPRGLMGV